MTIVPAGCKSDGEYERRFGDVGDWTPALSFSVEEDALVVSGSCPCCKHQMDDFVSLTPAWLRKFRKDQDVVTVLACNCVHTHAGQPEKTVGCGLSAVVTFRLSKPDKKKPEIDAEMRSARPASMRERTWDDEAAKYEQAMTARLSDTATKWAQTVAAIFGLFGLALILESERIDTVVASDATWPWWVLAGVLGVTGAMLLAYAVFRPAKDEPEDGLLYVGSISASVAAVIVIVYGAGWDPLTGGVAFGAIAGLTIFFALFATAYAGIAAQGSPKWTGYLTGDRMRRRSMEIGDESVRNLRRARLATVLAVGALGAALAVLWYSPEPTPEAQTFEIQTRGGSNPCGTITSNGGSGVIIDPSGDDQDRHIAVDDVIAIRPKKCR